uniref:Secreted protein n=1 Tax=Zea mays TaxID=4577 RepID=A0A804NZT6_MAIZE
MRSVCYFVVASSFVLAIDANSVPLTTPTAVPSSPEPSAPESPRAATQPAGLIVESRPALICCGQEDNKKLILVEDSNSFEEDPHETFEQGDEEDFDEDVDE